MTTDRPDSPAAARDLLDRMQMQTDPLADKTIGEIVTPWVGLPKAAPPVSLMSAGQPTAAAALASQASFVASFASQWQPRRESIAEMNAVFAQWTDNGAVRNWNSATRGVAPKLATPLDDYLAASKSLPPWADTARIARAEQLFMDYGPLSVTLLFCASLPQCYVVPDLAAVLHVTGQLEKHTEYRIRSTGAMVFPVMMAGGLTDDASGGLSQIFKVRLIHATIRNLILRGNPAAFAHLHADAENSAVAGIVPMLAALQQTDDMHQALFAHGWDVPAEGLPCNQEELAYTLLTFSYVFLNGMRTLGLGFSRADEEAYLHTWNVAGHLLGIERELMVDTMDEAAALFERMQARGRADREAKNARDPAVPDPRPALGRALMDAMASAIPLPLFKSFPTLLTRYLCGPATSRDLGLDGRVSWISKLVFCAIVIKIRIVDKLVRLVVPDFSLARLFTRVIGYQLTARLLMDQTRPLKLPNHLLNRVNTMMGNWGNDNLASGWMNSIEDSMTVTGSWHQDK